MRVENGVLYDVFNNETSFIENDPESFWEGVTEIGEYALIIFKVYANYLSQIR